jgi:hypothetical protein
MRRTSLAIIALVFVVINGLSQHQEGLKDGEKLRFMISH